MEWHSHALSQLKELQSSRCASDDLPSADCLPVMAFYMNHSILVINAQALKGLSAAKESERGNEIVDVSRQTLEAADVLLGYVFSERVFLDRLAGLHNNQFLMVCHSAIEILQARNGGGLTPTDVQPAVFKIRAILEHMEAVGPDLPSTSAIHLYTSLLKFVAKRLDMTHSTPPDRGSIGGISQAWEGGWKPTEFSAYDCVSWADLGLFVPEQPLFFHSNLEGTHPFDYNSYSVMF
ncbi:hypothetical protein LTS17_001906 [Exophiala oligosperma]